ncbi:MAG: peptidylprolyl isomerase [Methylotenera sp.]|uniref:SurA N-terminal domain-containing protein n=1 Tax=Methylotenera sp. TaxID=2051956 RepID=UPI00185782D9|nr:SurA N-terminal domain-containing protein [Methylotenera sp.]NOU25736.1 peptidylprolyl isomerase [Methylotenera sp.]
MLDEIRTVAQGWVGKALLAIIAVPFALFGIDSYLSNAGSNVTVAKVGGNEITIQEYDNALKNMRNRLQSEGKFDQAQLESPEVKSLVLNQLINKQLLSDEIQRAKYAISDEHLATYVTGMPEFQKDGKFSQELYDQTLSQNQLTPSRFEAGMRADLLAQQAQDGIARLGFISNARAEDTLKLTNQKRVVTVAEIKTKDFISQVNVDEAQVKAYYEKHKDKLIEPEKVKLEFVTLAPVDFMRNIKVDDAEVKRFYDENTAKFQGSEQRRASHILIGFGVSASAEQKQQAREKAEKILAEIKKNPKSFESLAVKESQDPGSAVKGGDLGSFARGAMVKPFEDAAFSLKVGEISNLVESEFGYHIIKLTEITGQSSDFESLKPQIKGDLMFQKAQEEFAKQAENFNSLVYEQSTSLQPAAKVFGGQVQKSDWLNRETGTKFFKNNEKIMNLVFSSEVLKDRRNTEAVEVSPNNLVSARVVEYKPAAPKNFEEVKSGIEALLKLEAASKLATEKGEAALKNLREGKDAVGIEWIPEVTVDRRNAQGLTDLAMNQVFKTNVAKLPAFSGLTDEKQGYLLVKVIKVDTSSDEEEAKQLAKKALTAALANEYLAAYKQSLREKAKVTVNEKVLLSDAVK